METKIFDRETILDLIVNFIPLGILLFFIAAFVVYAPWGFDLMTSGLMLAIMVSMFIALSVLTYFSATAIAGDEKRATVYAQGQAGLEGAKPLHELEAESADVTDGDDGASSDTDDDGADEDTADEADDVDDDEEGAADEVDDAAGNGDDETGDDGDDDAADDGDGEAVSVDEVDDEAGTDETGETEDAADSEADEDDEKTA